MKILPGRLEDPSEELVKRKLYYATLYFFPVIFFFMYLYDVIIPEESLRVEVVLVHVVVLLPDQVWTLTQLYSVDFYNQG